MLFQSLDRASSVIFRRRAKAGRQLKGAPEAVHSIGMLSRSRQTDFACSSSLFSCKSIKGVSLNYGISVAKNRPPPSVQFGAPW
jgi:hypothetical protein